MPYTPVTPAQFKQFKPQFAAVPDDTVQAYLTMAEVYVDPAIFPEQLYQPAIIAVTCHLMTLDGLGTDPASTSFAKGTAAMQTIRSGDFTLTRFKSEAVDAGMSTVDWFGQTPCGQQFMVWVRMFAGGPLTAIGRPMGLYSTYAKDAPNYRDSWWWP